MSFLKLKIIERSKPMKKIYIVKLTDEERATLNKLLSNGSVAAKRHEISRVLLCADASPGGLNYTDEEIKDEIDVSTATIARIRKKFVEGGVKQVFRKKYTPRYTRRKFDGEGEARLIALCCSPAPEGHARWTLQLLAEKAVELKIVDCVSDDTIHRTLKKMSLSLGRKKNGVYRQKRMQNLSARWKMS
jgi:hypothetical protein